MIEYFKTMKSKSKFIVILLLLLLAMPMQAQYADELPTKETRLKKFKDYSGKGFLNVISLGYTFSFHDTTHLVSASILDFRAGMFGMSPLAVEMSVKPLEYKFIYKPSIRLYVPLAKCFSFVPYAGVMMDATGLGLYLIPNYKYDFYHEFFMNAFAGVAFNLSAIKNMPLEIKLEYRHPITQCSYAPTDFYPRGLYLSTQLYIGKSFKNK
jgi:hypothetical protein